MKTVVLGSRPAEVEALIEKRRRLGQDLLDEIWEGDYHMVPAPHPRHGALEIQLARLLGPAADAVGLTASGPFNVGEPGNFRVPDQGYYEGRPDEVFLATASVVVEVRSPGDETYEKFGFYADHQVDEIVVLEPDDDSVRWFALADGDYVEVDRSAVLTVDVADIESQLAW